MLLIQTAHRPAALDCEVGSGAGWQVLIDMKLHIPKYLQLLPTLPTPKSK